MIHFDGFDFNDYINATKDIVLDYHVNHCLFALDTVFRCKADISPVVLEEVGDPVGLESEERVSAWVLRDPVKRCRKFEPVRDWFAEHSICSSFCSADEIYGNGSAKHNHHHHHKSRIQN